MIIDAQVHAYEANSPERTWHTVPNWPDHVTGDEMVAAMAAATCTVTDVVSYGQAWMRNGLSWQRCRKGHSSWDLCNSTEISLR